MYTAMKSVCSSQRTLDENILQLVFNKKGFTIMENYEKIVARLQNDLDLGRCGSDITEYSSGYITDIYMEIADENTSIYYYDIERYLVDNIDAVSDWILENSYPGDLYKAAQGAEFDSIYRELLENSNDILLFWAYTYILDTYGDELDQLEELEVDYMRSEISFDVDRLESIEDQADKLAMSLLERRDKEEQE